MACCCEVLMFGSDKTGCWLKRDCPPNICQEMTPPAITFLTISLLITHYQSFVLLPILALNSPRSFELSFSGIRPGPLPCSVSFAMEEPKNRKVSTRSSEEVYEMPGYLIHGGAVHSLALCSFKRRFLKLVIY